MSIKISKSEFIAGCQCFKRLYLQVHEPKLAAEPDAAAEAIIVQISLRPRVLVNAAPIP